MRYELLTMPHCPNCPAVKEWCESRFEGEAIDCGADAGLDFARARGVSSTPTAIFYGEDGEEIGRFHSVGEIREALDGV